MDKDISVRAAGGFMLQLLPDVSDEDIDRIEKILKDMKPISTLIDQGLTPEEILRKSLGSLRWRFSAKPMFNINVTVIWRK